MNCTVLTAEAISRDVATARTLMRHLTLPGSEFQRKLHKWLSSATATPEDGVIALVRDDDDIVGWARTESWMADVSIDTLEAFTHLGWRRRGVAGFAAAGLVAAGALAPLDKHGRQQDVAVFRPSMLLLARRVGLYPRLFQRDESGKWAQA